MDLSVPQASRNYSLKQTRCVVNRYYAFSQYKADVPGIKMRLVEVD